MNFRWFTDEKRELEEGAIFALSRQIRIPQSVQSDSAKFRRYIYPLFESRTLHSDKNDNFIALAILGRFFDPSAGYGKFMPQTTDHWLALRRLFLEVSSQSVPRDLQSSEPARWNDEFRPRLDEIREITKSRLQSYEGVSPANARKLFVETGEIHVDSACGAFFRLHEKIPFGLLPSSRTPPEGNCTTALLRRAAEEAGIGFDFESEYQAAFDSVRAVIFDIALEATFGKVPSDSTSLWELELMAFEKSIVEDPTRLFRDERLVDFMVERMAEQGSVFLGRLSRLFATAEKNPFRFNIRQLKLVLCEFWLHPDFPLWLMQTKAIEALLSTKYSDISFGLKNKINEVTKNRASSPENPLRSASKKLVTGIKLHPTEKTYQGMDFQSYLRSSPSFPGLEKHVSALSISDLHLEPQC
ncbi:MAG: hypothetical protein KDN20_01490 [Verrucomicrobiae bacterium]|nr:hypothetical protein [Verrucomicrobiae bacterium]